MLLEISGLSGGYHGVDVCQQIGCALEAGEVLSVVGPNGCGKTTFFRLLIGSLAPSGGDVQVDGQSILPLPPRERARLIAYIPQQHRPNFGYTAFEVVLMGRASHHAAFRGPREEDRAAALDALAQLRIGELADCRYTALSAGQRQMVLIARALCQRAKLLVMDEPAASLDYANQQVLTEVIAQLAAGGYGVVLSTHSPAHPFSVADRALLMRDGRVEALGPPREAITGDSLERVYGIPMDVVTVKDRGGRAHTLCLPMER